jgi:hypothetical protein
MWPVMLGSLSLLGGAVLVGLGFRRRRRATRDHDEELVWPPNWMLTTLSDGDED